MRELLVGMLDECKRCRKFFYDNVAMIADGGEPTDDQIAEVIVQLHTLHVASHDLQ